MRNQHVEPARRWHAQRAPLLDQCCFERIVNRVDYAFKLRKRRCINSPFAVVGKHAAGRGVDDYLCIGVIDVGLCVRNHVGKIRARFHGAAQSNNVQRACRTCHGARRFARATCTADEHFLSAQVKAEFFDKRLHSRQIGVVAAKFSVAVDNAIDRPDFRSKRVNLVQIRNDILLIRYGHVNAAEGARFHESGKIRRFHRVQLVAIPAQALMDFLGETVAQRHANQTVFHRYSCSGL